MPSTLCIKADLNLQLHAESIVFLLDSYARDPAGGATALEEFTKNNLIAELKKRATAHVFLAFVEDRAVGLITSFEGFSSFQCKPLLNLHDVFVLEDYRGRGISKQLLATAEAFALGIGCCKLTLEVLENNIPARSSYEKFGFESYSLDPVYGQAKFMHKKLI